MNKFLKSATVLVPVLTLGVIAGTVSAAEMQSSTPIFKKFNIQLSEEQKATMEKIHELRKAGKIDEAKALAESSGLPAFDHVMKIRGDKGGKMLFMNDEMRKNHEAVRTAIQNNDYAAFKAASANLPFATEIDEAKFVKLVEAHKLMDQAHALLKEAGIKEPFLHAMPIESPVETP